MADNGGIIKITTNDGVTFDLHEKHYQCSTTIMNLIEIMEIEDFVIPLENVNSEIFDIITSYCAHHYDNPNDNPMNSVGYSDFDDKLLSNDIGTLFEIIQAANYLNIDNILELVTKGVAYKMEGKSVEQLRDMLNVENDYTPEQENMIRQKYAILLKE